MPVQQHQPVERLSYTVDQFVEATGFARRRVYTAIASGELRTFKAGKRRMISADAAREYIARRERETADAEGR